MVFPGRGGHQFTPVGLTAAVLLRVAFGKGQHTGAHAVTDHVNDALGFRGWEAPVDAIGADTAEFFAVHPPSMTSAEVPAAPRMKERRDIRDMG